MGIKELCSQNPSLLTCLLPSSWRLNAQSQALWGLWAVPPRPQTLSCTPCWTWRNLYHPCPRHRTTPQSIPAAQKQMRRGEAKQSPIGGTKEGDWGWGQIGGEGSFQNSSFQALTLSLLLPASPTMAPWTAQCPYTLLIAPLLMRPSWGYEETVR